MKSGWKTLSSAGKASMTGAQWELGEHNLGECLLIKCSFSAPFLILLSASRCVAACPYS